MYTTAAAEEISAGVALTASLVELLREKKITAQSASLSGRYFQLFPSGLFPRVS